MALRSARHLAPGLLRARDAIASNTSDTLSDGKPWPFGVRPRKDRSSLRRVNDEGFFGPRCLPSTNASLVRAACAATSANPPATSARLCRRSLASGALFSPLPPACAFGSGRRPIPLFRSRATRSAFASSNLAARCCYAGGVWRRSSTSAINSNPRAQPSNRPIPAGSIASIDAVFARAGRTRALSKAETLVDLSLLVTGLLPSNQGPVAFAFAMHQRDRCASGAFARSSPQLRSYPDFDVCKHLSSQSAWRVRELETPFLAGALGRRRAYPEPGSSASTREPSPARGARAS